MKLSPDRLRNARVLAGLSQRALAQSAGVSETTVVRLEGGATPHPGTVKALADALAVPVSRLYEADDAEVLSR